MKKILFRADGNALTGLGHLYRIFALIEIFKAKYECTLITRTGSENIIPDSYRRITLPENVSIENEPQWLKESFNAKEHWIIADGYQFDSVWQKAIKDADFRLMYIDDTKQQRMYADVVVNHALGVKARDYKAEFYTRFALGTSYAILRPMFLEAAKSTREITKISTAFICFGGADPGDLSFKAAQAVINSKLADKIHVVLGGAYKHNSIVKLAEQNPHLKLHRNLNEKDLVEVMKNSDFAIASASTILYELCAVKMPVISGYYVENQKSIYEGCIQNGLIFPAGNFEKHGVNDFERDLEGFVKKDDWMQYVKTQSQLFDSKIEERIGNLLNDITYRKAELSDMTLVFDWANDSLSRANSYFSEPIALETHKSWFEKKLKDSKSIMFIAEVDGKAAGFIRYDVSEKNAVVGIMLDKEFRGKGLAPYFLRDTARFYFSENSLPILAYIKVQNIFSVKSFERAGYKRKQKEMVHGQDSYVYELENKH